MENLNLMSGSSDINYGPFLLQLRSRTHIGPGTACSFSPPFDTKHRHRLRSLLLKCDMIMMQRMKTVMAGKQWKKSRSNRGALSSPFFLSPIK